MMIQRLSLSIATVFLAFLLCHVTPLNGQNDAFQGDIAASQVVCDPRDYGASSDLLDNANAIQDACAKQGGGRVPLSNGTFRSGPLVITGTNVVLEIGSNAILDMAYLPDTWPVDLNDDRGNGGVHRDVIRFENCIGCSLSGSGLLHGGGIRDEWYYRFDNGTLPYQRTFYLKVLNCENFKIQGSLTILNSPMWTVTLLNVHGAEISGLNVTSNYYVHPETGVLREPHNTDGIDVCEGSSDIWIHNVWIRNGDDSVVIKAGAVVNLTIGARWSSSNPCTRNVLVEDSHFELGHGCSIGSLASGCIENVIFRNITMANIGGCRIKTYPTNDEGGGGFIRNITFADVVMDNTHDCIYVNGYYNKNAPANAKHFVNVSGLTFSNLKGSNCGRNPAYFVCQPEMPCTDIFLDDLMLNLGGNGKYPMQCENAVESSKDSTNGTVILPSSCLSPPLTQRQESGFRGGRVGVVVVVVLLTIVLCGERCMNRRRRAVGQVRYLEMSPSISPSSRVTSDEGSQEERGQGNMQTYTIT